MRLNLTGWKGKPDKDKLRDKIRANLVTEPAVKNVALSMIDSRPLPRQWKRNTRRWYRTRARQLLENTVMLDPEWYGLKPIDPNKINHTMTTAELAEFCQVQVYKVRELARRAPGNGLPVPEWPLGRTCKGRGWRFPAETARAYARRLLELD